MRAVEHGVMNIDESVFRMPIYSVHEVRTSRVVERGAAETSSRRRPVTWSCAWTDGHRKPF